MTLRIESAREAQTRAENRVTILERDLGDLQQQVAPVVGLVEEARSNAQHGRNMSRQRQLMLQSLVKRAHSVGDNLRIEVPNFAVAGSDDEAAYTFFEQFLGKLEETAKGFDERSWRRAAISSSSLPAASSATSRGSSPRLTSRP